MGRCAKGWQGAFVQASGMPPCAPQRGGRLLAGSCERQREAARGSERQREIHLQAHARTSISAGSEGCLGARIESRSAKSESNDVARRAPIKDKALR